MLERILLEILKQSGDEVLLRFLRMLIDQLGVFVERTDTSIDDVLLEAFLRALRQLAKEQQS